MAKEEEAKAEKTFVRAQAAMKIAPLLANPWVWVVIAVVALAIIGGYIWLMPSDYKMPVLIAIAVGTLLSLQKFSVGKLIFNIAICIGIAVIITAFSSQLMTYGGTAIASVKGMLGTLIPSLKESVSPEYYYNIGNTKPEQQLGTTVIAVDWKNAVEREPVDVVVPVKVKTSEQLSLIPKCFLGDKEITTTISGGGNELNFLPSNQEQQSSVTCYNDKLLSNSLAIKFETNQNKSISLEAKIGNGPLETIPSIQATGPYMITLKFEDRQPFKATSGGSAKYPLFVNMKKQTGSDFVLSRLDYLSITTKDALVDITCPEIKGSKDSLKAWADKEGYSFKCDFIVKDNPVTVQRLFITADIKYSLEADYRTTLKNKSS